MDYVQLVEYRHKMAVKGEGGQDLYTVRQGLVNKSGNGYNISAHIPLELWEVYALAKAAGLLATK